MLDIGGNIAENSTGNFFFVRDGTICTSGAGMALEGVTRATIFELARNAGIPVATGEFPLFDVLPRGGSLPHRDLLQHPARGQRQRKSDECGRPGAR
jgi:hypothetical protein